MNGVLTSGELLGVRVEQTEGDTIALADAFGRQASSIAKTSLSKT